MPPLPLHSLGPHEARDPPLAPLSMQRECLCIGSQGHAIAIIGASRSTEEQAWAPPAGSPPSQGASPTLGFDAVDLNGDGIIDREEWNQAFGPHSEVHGDTLSPGAPCQLHALVLLRQRCLPVICSGPVICLPVICLPVICSGQTCGLGAPRLVCPGHAARTVMVVSSIDVCAQGMQLVQ